MNRCKDTAKGANCALRHNDVCLAEHWWECVEGLRKQRKTKKK